MRLPVSLFLFLAIPPVAVSAQAVRYEVSVPTPALHLLHVKADFPSGGKDTLYLSLPAWSPGNYEIQNYARYVRGFGAKTAAGASLFWDRFDKDTWRVVTGKSDRVQVEFDYFADSIDLSMARVLPDFAEILGTNVFLYEEGKLDRPAEVRFTLPAGWKLATALKGGADGTYQAPNYHELVDAVTFLGSFSLDSVVVDGKPVRIAVWPAADYTAPVAKSLRESVTRIATEENKEMGGPPYDAYTIFFNVIHEPVNFGGGLEHSYSQFDIMPANAFADPQSGQLGDFMNPLLSHEMFHLWNVKRMRPAEMWPYDYHAEQFTPLLWWSEGVTDYYADLTNWRAGIWDDNAFLGNVMQNIQQVESAPEPWSEEDGSEATWINEVYVNSSQLYYPKGSLTGLLLDISIRDATNNAHSLDEVTRALFERYYKQGKGFRTSDLLALLREFGLPDVDGFYQKFINGRDALPYEQVFPLAGLVAKKIENTSPFLGVQTTGDGAAVAGLVPGGAAEAAGLQVGDTLISIGSVQVAGQVGTDWGQAYRTQYKGKAGQPIDVVVRRKGQVVTLHTQVKERTVSSYHVTKADNPTAKATRIWKGLASGTIGQ